MSDYCQAKSPDYGFSLMLPTGRYTLFAFTSGGADMYGTAAVDVTDNVSGVTLTMNPPFGVSGQVNLAESGSQMNLKGIELNLGVVLDTPGGDYPAFTDASGGFHFRLPVAPGHYAIYVRNIPDGCFVQKMKFGGQEVSPYDFQIMASAPLEVVLSHTAGKIAGSAVDHDGKPLPDTIVTLIPADPIVYPQKQSADDDGNFHFTNLRPGKYKLYAWEEVDEGLWQDPDFLKKFESRATEITVGPSESQTAQVHLIEVSAMR